MLKIDFEKFFKLFHFKKVFLVILALININGISFRLISFIKFGQISDSIKIATEGSQLDKNFLTNILESIGRNWCIVFLSLNFFNTFDELKVLDVIRIFFIFLFFSNFSTKGIMLKISPTLEP